MTPGAGAARHDARQAICALADELHRHGIAHIYGRGTPALAVLSIRTGLTIWCHRRVLTWNHQDGTTTWPAADTYGATRDILHHLQHQPDTDGID
jgi:hypothetical protein